VTERVWLRPAWVEALHVRQAHLFGGTPTDLDVAAIGGALDLVRRRWSRVPGADPRDIGATYGCLFSRAALFPGGHPRLGFLCMATFLDLHDWWIGAPEPEAVRIMGGVATGAVDERRLAEWVRVYARPSAADAEPGPPAPVADVPLPLAGGR